MLHQILSELGDDDLARRDAAMLALLYMLALRRSELVEIDYQSHGDGLSVLRVTDDGHELELLRSKTSQERSDVVAVDRAHNPRGFAAVEAWVRHAQIEPGTPLFRRIHPRGGVGGRITADGIDRAIKAAVRRYYISTGTDADTAERLAARFSGHSGPRGLHRRLQGGRRQRQRHCSDDPPQELGND
jgi:site-specific recombinase XerC